MAGKLPYTGIHKYLATLFWYACSHGSDNTTESRPPGFIDELGALFTFSPAPSGKTTILARVGVSLISSEQACANAEEEIPDFDFERVHRESRAQWNDVLGRVQVDMTGVSKETVQLFYSSVRTKLFPRDIV